MTQKHQAIPQPAASAEFATITDAQQMLGGESRSSIYRALQRGELHAVKRGRRTLILVASIRQRIAEMPTARFLGGDAA